MRVSGAAYWGWVCLILVAYVGVWMLIPALARDGFAHPSPWRTFESLFAFAMCTWIAIAAWRKVPLGFAIDAAVVGGGLLSGAFLLSRSIPWWVALCVIPLVFFMVVLARLVILHDLLALVVAVCASFFVVGWMPFGLPFAGLVLWTAYDMVWRSDDVSDLSKMIQISLPNSFKAWLGTTDDCGVLHISLFPVFLVCASYVQIVAAASWGSWVAPCVVLIVMSLHAFLSSRARSLSIPLAIGVAGPTLFILWVSRL